VAVPSAMIYVIANQLKSADEPLLHSIIRFYASRIKRTAYSTHSGVKKAAVKI